MTHSSVGNRVKVTRKSKVYCGAYRYVNSSFSRTGMSIAIAESHSGVGCFRWVRLPSLEARVLSPLRFARLVPSEPAFDWPM